MLRCAKCGTVFEKMGIVASASISGSIMGDEYTESLYLCPGCDLYTIEIYHDRFLGEEETQTRGPVPRAEGDALVKMIERCPEPWDKKCRCEAHREYFDGALD